MRMPLICMKHVALKASKGFKGMSHISPVVIVLFSGPVCLQFMPLKLYCTPPTSQPLRFWFQSSAV